MRVQITTKKLPSTSPKMATMTTAIIWNCVASVFENVSTQTKIIVSICRLKFYCRFWWVRFLVAVVSGPVSWLPLLDKTDSLMHTRMFSTGAAQTPISVFIWTMMGAEQQAIDETFCQMNGKCQIKAKNQTTFASIILNLNKLALCAYGVSGTYCTYMS